MIIKKEKNIFAIIKFNILKGRCSNADIYHLQCAAYNKNDYTCK